MHTELLEHAARLLGEARRVVALTGAGISRPSGIPDFRSPDGVWAHTDPMEVASLRTFHIHPERFYDWLRPMLELLLIAHPNPAHHALAQLEHAGVLHAVVTQNIDGLHQRAGSREVYELHGNLRQATCINCERQIPAPPMIEEVRRGKTPICSCGGALKPDVVLFDEALPRGLFWLAQHALETCDVLLVAGTSLEVYPVSDLPLSALRHGARLIIVNLEETYLDERADAVLHEDVALALPVMIEQALQYRPNVRA
jgi:NAD-dependent deacetylase